MWLIHIIADLLFQISIYGQSTSYMQVMKHCIQKHCIHTEVETLFHCLTALMMTITVTIFIHHHAIMGSPVVMHVLREAHQSH